MKTGKALTWDEVADFYDEVYAHSSRLARTLPLDTVFSWLENQDGFTVTEDGTIHQIKEI